MIGHGFGVLLGAIDAEHVPVIRKWRNTYDIWKWCRQHDLITEAAHLRWFERQEADPSIRMYMIHANGQAVGVCGLTDIDLHNRRAEFSLYIAPDHQGAGYGKRALQTLLTHAFKTLNLNTVFGETFDGNPAGGMFESIGFKKEGTRRAFYFREGAYVDAHLYSICAHEWGIGVPARQARLQADSDSEPQRTPVGTVPTPEEEREEKTRRAG